MVRLRNVCVRACVGMYVCAYVCMYVHMYLCMHAHVYACMPIYMFECIHVTNIHLGHSGCGAGRGCLQGEVERALAQTIQVEVKVAIA